MRSDLYGVLADEARRRGVEFVHDKRLVHAETGSDGTVLARFADGTEAEGDVLIGADGAHSATRAILDPRAPRPRETGMGNVGGVTRNAGLGLAPGTFRMMFGKRAFFGYAVHPSGDVWWFANPPVPYPPDPDAAWLAGLFDEDAGPASSLIRATTEPIVFSSQHELPTVPTWHRGAMVLVGDAAHATSPSSGQGASMAIEDALVLGQCLRDVPSTREAFATFERVRRARVEKVVAQGKRNGSGKAPGVVGAVMRDLFMPVMARQMEKKNLLGWITDHRIAWDDKVA